ncbi:hypothetical protein GGS20DRAFT_566914 [Poronia punctata]|nr:hypothetical protein GGS20DRAFT_566914 [Poronia punctata]
MCAFWVLLGCSAYSCTRNKPALFVPASCFPNMWLILSYLPTHGLRQAPAVIRICSNGIHVFIWYPGHIATALHTYTASYI